MLYATGCRVSEISHLKLEDVHLGERFCRCLGKGNKQRLVHLGSAAIDALRKYLDALRPRLAGSLAGAEDWLFVSRSGKRLRRQFGSW
jgi:integrase/recombinase XerD